MTLFNNYLLVVEHFPVTLAFVHLAGTTIFTQLLARYTPLITRPSSPITGRLYLRTILPIGLLYTLSLLCSNMTYNSVPLPNTEMLKALAPLFTLLISWAMSLTNPKVTVLGNMAVIAFGACVSTFGGMSFLGRGFLVCVLGTAAECGRLLIVERLLKEPRRGRFPGAGTPVVLDEEDGEAEIVAPTGGMGMSPLVALYYFAPVCMFSSGSLALVFELRTFSILEVQRVGIWTLVLSCVVAFMLNVAGVFLISKTSALAVSLIGFLNSPFPILASLLFSHTPITFTQIMGYGVALAGAFFYSLSPDGMGPQVDAWFGIPTGSDTEAGSRESTTPLMAKASEYLGSLIVINPQNGDEEVQRGRSGRRDGTPRPSPPAEKIRISVDSVTSKGEPPSGKVAGLLA
ncbi:hypothetical protein N0V82_005757 [Gnomoniopsis sp. IMI 355080]|nr:hypothetical protein N0V82_005757 [Gnomoniopsis sp. IMI 355080]